MNRKNSGTSIVFLSSEQYNYNIMSNNYWLDLFNSIAIEWDKFLKNNSDFLRILKEILNFVINFNRDDFIKSLKPFDHQLIEIGWPPSFRLTLGEANVMFNIDKSLTKSQIEKFLLKTFDNKLLFVMIAEWQSNSILSKRAFILKDAVFAHNAELYTLSVPVLLTQAEGIIASMCEITGRKGHKAIINGVNILSQDIALQESYMHFLMKSFCEEFEFGKDVFYSLGRHSILHGVNLKYATKENSLKCILLIDFLYYLAKHKTNKKLA